MGKSIYEAFKTDATAENEGQWFNYGPGPSGKDQRFLLARMSRSNRRYMAGIQRLHSEYGRQVDAGTIADEVAYPALLRIFCTTVLLDWEGICGESGEELAYSSDAAVMLLTELPDLYQELQSLAQARENFLQQQKEDDAGN